MFCLRFRVVYISRNDKLFFPPSCVGQQKPRDKYRMIRFERTTDRPTDRPTSRWAMRSNVANVVIVIGLICHCGAVHRGTTRRGVPPSLWVRVSSDSRNRGNEIMLQFSVDTIFGGFSDGRYIRYRALFGYIESIAGATRRSER